MVKVGISMGDPNGVGAEIILKTFNDARLFDDLIPVVYGCSSILSHYKKLMPNDNIKYAKINSVDNISPKQINVVSIWEEEFIVQPGKATQAGGEFSFMALEAATSDLASGKIDVLITAPINKKTIQNDDFQFPGHTEYLTKMSNAEDSLMLMVLNNLRVGVATNHIPVSAISSALSIDLISSKLSILNQSLITDFGISKPKIAVLGLNPHAGENGLLGSEEAEIIKPAIEKIKSSGVLAFGPFPADGFFGSKNISSYDGVLAMYHDQGLIPFKSIAIGNGVNYTAGLPIVRTSPDHGTAYDISGKNKASANSLRNAVYLACDIYKQRTFQKQISANPLIVGVNK
jgi:4-hydroxythreonine-4-phosphate dehydrogenase